MKELEFLGGAIDQQTPEAPPSREHQDFKTLDAKRRLSLLEASSLSGLTVHELKRAIQEGNLPARWEGKYVIARADLDAFLHS